jgi:secondary thiamine-phosphate synthase enzyme
MNMQRSCKLTVRSGPRTDFVDITDAVTTFVGDSGVKSGLCVVLVTHSTAGITLNSIGDPATRKDLVSEIDRIVPTRVDFHHQFDTPRDAAAHIKLLLVGNSVLLPIEGGSIPLSVSSGILLAEFDGPRERTVTVQIWDSGHNS